MTDTKFDKYEHKGSMHWDEMMSKDVRKFNSYQQGRYDWILKVTGEIKGKKVLDLGCGDGALSYLLQRRGALVTGVDNEQQGLDFAQKNVSEAKFVNASAYDLPFPDESFDLVVSSELIEHLDRPETMLSETKRVLKPAGRLVLTTPHRLTEKPGDKYHFHEFFPEELESLVKTDFNFTKVILSHHVFWYGLYTYAARKFKNRQFGMWFINALTLWFNWNPFLIEYETSTKRDVFTQIIVVAKK